MWIETEEKFNVLFIFVVIHVYVFSNISTFSMYEY